MANEGRPDQLSVSDKASIWSSIYQAERSDLTTLYVTALVVLGFILSYISAAAAYLAVKEEPLKASPNVIVFLPFPALALLLFNYQLAGVTRGRSVSCERLEFELFTLLGYESLTKPIGSDPGVHYGRIGVSVGERLLGLSPKSTWVAQVAILGANLAAGVATISFAVFTIVITHSTVNILALIFALAIDVGMVVLCVMLVRSTQVIASSKYPGGGVTTQRSTSRAVSS